MVYPSKISLKLCFGSFLMYFLEVLVYFIFFLLLKFGVHVSTMKQMLNIFVITTYASLVALNWYFAKINLSFITVIKKYICNFVKAKQLKLKNEV